MSITSMSMVVRMFGFTIIFNFHDSSSIVTISMIDHMLDPAIREVDIILSLHVTSLIASPLLSKVCIVFVIMNSILVVKWVWVLIIILSTTMTNSIANTSSNWTSRKSKGIARKADQDYAKTLEAKSRLRKLIINGILCSCLYDFGSLIN